MAAQVEIEDQESVTNLDNGEIINPISDNAPNFSGDATILLREATFEHNLIKNCFLSGMGSFATETTIVTVRKILTQRLITTKAKFAVFKLFTEAMKRKNNGYANIRALVGEGDEEGIKNILLCRVILGKPEQIVTGSKQSYPSSNQFDSGVDNLENPRKYVIWSCNMNSYILPTYIVSFKSHLLRGLIGRARKRKLRREQLVRKIREVVGDNLLFKILKNQRR